MKWLLVVLAALAVYFVSQQSPSVAQEAAPATTSGKSPDPVDDVIFAFRQQTREMFNYSKFDELESHIADLRKKDEASGSTRAPISD